MAGFHWQLWFGLTIIFLSLVGIFLAPARLRWSLISLWLGYLLYGLTLPFQMYTHSYYHVQLIPVVALGLAAALNPVMEKVLTLGRMERAGFLAVILVVIGYQAPGWRARFWSRRIFATSRRSGKSWVRPFLRRGT
ncbi:MAG: hypothetical protein FJZ87_13780 [Chloroflexi bacterium]|nr:hypothetical protein [Chloroflexota bacterium]